MSAGQASTSDARKRRAERKVPAQGDVIEQAADVLRETIAALVQSEVTAGEAVYVWARALAAAGLLPARPEHEVKAEALRLVLAIVQGGVLPTHPNASCRDGFTRSALLIEDEIARIESEAGGRP